MTVAFMLLDQVKNAHTNARLAKRFRDRGMGTADRERRKTLYSLVDEYKAEMRVRMEVARDLLAIIEAS